MTPLLLTAAFGLLLDAPPATVGDVVFYQAGMMGVAAAIAIFGSFRIAELSQQAHEAKQLGQYHLRRLLGSGGMGEVHLAEHRLLKRPCAVKQQG